VSKKNRETQTAPGSPEAQAAGCRCPRLDNLDMAGTGMRTISSACPLHFTERIRAQAVAGRAAPVVPLERGPVGEGPPTDQ
jgi:hypothetical protein